MKTPILSLIIIAMLVGIGCQKDTTTSTDSNNAKQSSSIVGHYKTTMCIIPGGSDYTRLDTLYTGAFYELVMHQSVTDEQVWFNSDNTIKVTGVLDDVPPTDLIGTYLVHGDSIKLNVSETNINNEYHYICKAAFIRKNNTVILRLPFSRNPIQYQTITLTVSDGWK